MAGETVYKKAVAALFQRTGAGLADRDVTVAVELFDLLLGRKTRIDPDSLKELCEKAHFDDFTSGKLAQIYDFVDVYRKYKGGEEIRHWTDEVIDDLFQ